MKIFLNICLPPHDNFKNIISESIWQELNARHYKSTITSK